MMHSWFGYNEYMRENSFHSHVHNLYLNLCLNLQLGIINDPKVVGSSSRLFSMAISREIIERLEKRIEYSNMISLLLERKKKPYFEASRYQEST